jgi:hypothetical protein
VPAVSPTVLHSASTSMRSRALANSRSETSAMTRLPVAPGFDYEPHARSPRSMLKGAVADAKRAYTAKLASMRAMRAGSSGPVSAAAMHSRTSVRFLQPSTTVSTFSMESA